MYKKAIGTVLLLLVVAGLLYRFLFSTPQVIPIYGKWISDDPPYDDCYMKITPQEIVFGEGQKLIGAYRIIRIEDETKAGKYLYTVHYDDDGELKIAFEYKAVNGGEIRIRNQERIVWTRSANTDPS